MSKSNFQRWLAQEFPVSYSEVLNRRSYIPLFAAEIQELLRRYGYVMDYRWKSGAFAIARWIYKIHCDIRTRYPKIEHRNYVEDNDEYLDTVTDEVLQDFLSHWNHIPDFDVDTKYGRILRNELQNVLWAYIDIDESPQGVKIMGWLDGSDTESDGGMAKVDSYLQDVDAGWHKSLR
jgi:hypothetical protein